MLIVTEWKEFKIPDFDEMRAHLPQPMVFDDRNLYEPKLTAYTGIEYHSIGRGAG